MILAMKIYFYVHSALGIYNNNTIKHIPGAFTAVCVRKHKVLGSDVAVSVFGLPSGFELILKLLKIKNKNEKATLGTVWDERKPRNYPGCRRIK